MTPVKAASSWWKEAKMNKSCLRSQGEWKPPQKPPDIYMPAILKLLFREEMRNLYVRLSRKKWKPHLIRWLKWPYQGANTVSSHGGSGNSKNHVIFLMNAILNPCNKKDIARNYHLISEYALIYLHHVLVLKLIRHVSRHAGYLIKGNKEDTTVTH